MGLESKSHISFTSLVSLTVFILNFTQNKTQEPLKEEIYSQNGNVESDM